MTEQLNELLIHANKSSCDMYHRIFNENIKQSINELHQNIEENIIKIVMTHIRTDDSYDYSTLPEIISVEELNKTSIPRLVNTQYFDNNNGVVYEYDTKKTISNKKAFLDFTTMRENEKIVFAFYTKETESFENNDDYNKYNNCNKYDKLFDTKLKPSYQYGTIGNDKVFDCNIYLTNNAKIMLIKSYYIEKDINGNNRVNCETIDFNFLIPKDYIIIINTLIKNLIGHFTKYTGKTIEHYGDNGNRGSYSETISDFKIIDIIFKNIKELLTQLKTSLYCNKFIPLYIKEENDRIKEENDRIKEENDRIKEEHCIEKLKLLKEIEFIKTELEDEREKYSELKLKFEKKRF